MFRRLLLATAAVVLLNGVPTPASAANCWFVAFNPWTGDLARSIDGYAGGVKKSGACRRAERRCNRKLRRAWNKGQAQSYGCRNMDDHQAVQ
jgi:hypothetical protein